MLYFSVLKMLHSANIRFLNQCFVSHLSDTDTDKPWVSSEQLWHKIWHLPMIHHSLVAYDRPAQLLTDLNEVPGGSTAFHKCAVFLLSGVSSNKRLSALLLPQEVVPYSASYPVQGLQNQGSNPDSEWDGAALGTTEGDGRILSNPNRSDWCQTPPQITPHHP
jgi:hypothetical protein